jgi:DNA-binding MarR family transcriptional regulator
MNKYNNLANSGNSNSENSTEAQITLGLLSVVEKNSSHTQRLIAGELGVALGLANTYLKQCVKKGWIKVNEAPANRYAYYLTPKGFAEKSRLTADYLYYSLNFFRSAKNQCSALFELCRNSSWNRIALIGATDFAEIAVLCAKDFDVELIGIVDPKLKQSMYSGVPLAAKLKDLGAVSAVIVTELKEAQLAYDTLVEVLPRERILTPPLLKVSRNKPILAE